MSLCAISLSSCESEEVRPVWISSASPSDIQVNHVIELRGRGFGEPAEGLVEEGAIVAYQGTYAVLVGGVSAGVVERKDDRLRVVIPELEPGPTWIVVWTEGKASNAYPITIGPSE